MMIMRLKCVSSSFYSSFCRHKAANPIFSSSPNTPSSSKLRYFSSSSDSSSKYPFPRRSRFDNPYIDRFGYPTDISLEQLEEFMKKYPVLASLDDLRNQNTSPRFFYIPHPDLVDMFLEVPVTEITYPVPSGFEHLEVKVHDPISDPNFEDTWYVDSDEEDLDGDDLIIPEGWPKDINYKNLRPKAFGDPPVISEEVDAIIYPPMTDFSSFWKYCEETRRKEKQNHEKNCVSDEEEG